MTEVIAPGIEIRRIVCAVVKRVSGGVHLNGMFLAGFLQAETALGWQLARRLEAPSTFREPEVNSQNNVAGTGGDAYGKHLQTPRPLCSSVPATLLCLSSIRSKCMHVALNIRVYAQSLNFVSL